jgi:predicted transcriptional regulator
MKIVLNIRIDKDLKMRLREIANINKRSLTRQIEYWIENEHIRKVQIKNEK